MHIRTHIYKTCTHMDNSLSFYISRMCDKQTFYPIRSEFTTLIETFSQTIKEETCRFSSSICCHRFFFSVQHQQLENKSLYTEFRVQARAPDSTTSPVSLLIVGSCEVAIKTVGPGTGRVSRPLVAKRALGNPPENSLVPFSCLFACASSPPAAALYSPPFVPPRLELLRVGTGFSSSLMPHASTK